MNAERWQQIRDLFLATLKRSPGERTAFLEEACAGDPELLREVMSLLEADAVSGLMDEEPWDLVAPHLSVPSALKEGDQVGPYRIVCLLGRGGMGTVYKAHDPRLDRYVALKLLPPYLSTSERANARFITEARAASGLDHPNICTIYDIGETETGGLFIAMACYEGETVKHKLENGPLSLDEAVDIARQTAEGLRHAHDAGIVHRDIKPANLLLTERGVLKILDFGIAKLGRGAQLTGTGLPVGTAAYMSPEQTTGAEVDQRTDVWALGVVLYEMLTGTRPFRSNHVDAVIYAIRHDDPEPVEALRPDVPEALCAVVRRALSKNPAERYEHMEALITDLDRIRGTKRSGTGDRVGLPVRRTGRLRWQPITGIGLLVLVPLLFWVQQVFFSPDASPVNAIAVLPLANYGAEDQEYFADGMTDALIADLGRIEALRVISRTSAMRYKGSDLPIPEIARELNVNAVVEGAVQMSDDDVRITVRLIEAASDQVLWTRHYERELRDILSLQREVALAIANEIEAELTPQDEQRLAQASSVHPDAYKQYLWGVHHRNRETPESWRQAVDHFEEAITIDPTFALAHAQLARVYVHVEGKAATDAARAAAEKALALDPGLSDAYVSLGLIREMLEWDWAGAEDAFLQAIRLNPGDGEAHHELGLLRMRMGRFDEALTDAQRALDLDPLSTRFLNGVAAVHLFSRRYDEAIALLQRSLELDPANSMTYWRLGQAYQQQGRHAEALQAFHEMRRLGGFQPIGHLGHAYAMTGRREEAQQVLQAILDEAQSGAPDPGWTPWNVALVYTGLGKHETALDWLEQAYEERSNVLMYLNILPALDPLRTHPRFQALLERINLRPFSAGAPTSAR